MKNNLCLLQPPQKASILLKIHKISTLCNESLNSSILFAHLFYLKYILINQKQVLQLIMKEFISYQQRHHIEIRERQWLVNVKRNERKIFSLMNNDDDLR